MTLIIKWSEKSGPWGFVLVRTGRKERERQTDTGEKQIDRKTNRLTERQNYRNTDRKTDRKTN
jgi:hypothetical protein